MTVRTYILPLIRTCCILLFIYHCVVRQNYLLPNNGSVGTMSKRTDALLELDHSAPNIYDRHQLRLASNSFDFSQQWRFSDGRKNALVTPPKSLEIVGASSRFRLRRSAATRKSSSKRKDKKRRKHGQDNETGQELRYPLENVDYYATPKQARKELGNVQKLCPIWEADSKIILSCSNGRHLGSRCNVRCPPGYKLTAKNKTFRRCRINKRKRRRKKNHHKKESRVSWTGKDQHFKCVSACQPLSAPPNGIVKCFPLSPDDPSTLTSQTCTVQCAAGHRVSHVSVRSCQSNGSWSGADVTCDPVVQRAPLPSPNYIRHQALYCGDVRSMTHYTQRGIVFLVAGDRSANVVRVFRWSEDRFRSEPHQLLSHFQPQSVDVVPTATGGLWLVVGNGIATTFYRWNKFSNKFIFSSTNSPLSGANKFNSNQTIGFDMIPLKGKIYRCTGKMRKGRSVVLVQKLITAPGRRGFFRRVVRRKMRSPELVYQCSLLPSGDSFNIVMTSNRPDGQGRIWIARPEKKRMKIDDVIKGNYLRNVSDVLGFRNSNQQFIVAAQRTQTGRCYVYKANNESAKFVT